MFTDAEVVKIVSAKKSLGYETVRFNHLIGQYCTHYNIEYYSVIQNFFVSGGYIPAILQGIFPKDIDIYGIDKSMTTDFLNWLELTCPQQIADVDPVYREVMGKNGKLITENAVTLVGSLPIQVITCESGTVEEVTKTFDFVHCTTSYNLFTNKLLVSQKQYDCIVNRTLMVNCPDKVTDKRIKKFKERGYTMYEELKSIYY